MLLGATPTAVARETRTYALRPATVTLTVSDEQPPSVFAAHLIFEGLVDYQEVFESWSGVGSFRRQRNDDLCITSLESLPTARVIDEYPAHLSGRDREEVRPVLPLNGFACR